MPVFLPARLYFMSVRDTISPPTTDVTRILQFIPQLKEVGEFLFFLKAGIPVVIREESYTSRASLLDLDVIPTYKKGDVTNHTFSGKRVRRGLYKTNSGLFINADINGAGNILRKEYPSAFDGQELSYLYETTKVVSYTDIYIGAKSLCNGRYNGKNHQSGMGSRANHQYRKERRHHYRSLWGKSRAA